MVARILRVALVVGLIDSVTACLWAQAPAGQVDQVLSAGQIVIIVPRSRDAVLGYSRETGLWHKQPIKAVPDTPILPLLGNEVAAVQVGNEVFALGVRGSWAPLPLPSDSKAIPVLNSKCVSIQTATTYYEFSATAIATAVRYGWSSVDLENGAIRYYRPDFQTREWSWSDTPVGPIHRKQPSD